MWFERESEVIHAPTLADAVFAECAPTDEDGEAMEGAFLTGFVVVSEWFDDEGRSCITRVHGDPRGRPPPPWRVMGWLDYTMKRFS